MNESRPGVRPAAAIAVIAAIAGLLAVHPAPVSALTDPFDDDPVQSPEWELYEPVAGSSYSSIGGAWRFTFPVGLNLDHWVGADSAVQLRRADIPEDFILETRVHFAGSGDPLNPFWPPLDESYRADLMVFFSQFDVFYWGFHRGTQLALQRSGTGLLCQVNPFLQDVSLRIVKTGFTYSFAWRAQDTDPWETVCTQESVAPPLYVGLMFKSWAPVLSTEETFDVDYFSIEEVPPEAPRLEPTCPLMSPDQAWIGMPYRRSIDAVGIPVPEVVLEAGPEGLAYDPAAKSLGGWTPDEFVTEEVRLRATNPTGEDTLSFSVEVAGESLQREDDFDSDPAFNTGYWELYEPQPGVAFSLSETEPGSSWWRMAVPLTGALGANFDTWVSVDRAPQLRHAIDPDQDFLIETRVRIAPEAAPPATDEFLAGLLIDFGPFDIVHWNIGQERTIAGLRTNLFLERSGLNNLGFGLVEGLLQGVPVRLRAERRCNTYSFYYRTDEDEAWTFAGSHVTDSVPLHYGLVMKTWGDGSAFTVDFDYFDEVTPGPRAQFTAEPLQGAEPLEVRVDGSASTSPRGAITAWSWDFGDGSTAEGPVQTHTYTQRGRYPLTLTITDATGDRGARNKTVEVDFRSGDIAPWTSSQVGEPPPVEAGGARLEGGCLTVLGGGRDIALVSDSFHFVHQPLSGDGAITARISAADFTPAAKVGVMLREDLTPGSRFAALLLNNATGKRFFLRRDNPRQTTRPAVNSTESFVLPSAWVRVERVGAEVIGSWSEDGVAWNELGRATHSLPAAVLGGLVVCARDVTSTGLAAQVEFCDVTLSGSVEPPAPPTGLTARAGPGQVDLDWDDHPGPTTGYNLYRATVSGGPYSPVNSVPLAASSAIDAGLTDGVTFFYVVRAVGAGGESGDSGEASATPGVTSVVFRRGDSDSSGGIDLSDAISVLQHLFLGGARPICWDAGDTDDNGVVDISDPIANLQYQFLGGPPPSDPGPSTCGPDPQAETPDLGCDRGC